MALLFSLADWSDRHTDRNTEACTDTKCEWDIPRKESLPMKLDDIEHSLNTRVQPFENVYNPASLENNGCDGELEMSLLNLIQGHDTQIIEILDQATEIENIPKSIAEYAHGFKETYCFLEYLRSKVTKDDCEKIYSLTDGQSENQYWYDYRFGRITSSIIPLVYRYMGNDENNYILKQILGNSYSLSTPAIIYGKEREHLARDLYRNIYSSLHEKSTIEISGLVINKDLPHLGASPDAIVNCKCCGKGLVEIKCPYTYRNLTIDEICDKNYHLTKSSNPDRPFNLKQSSNWYIQIQSQMAISNLSWCDFVVYLQGSISTEKHKIYVERIKFDSELWRSVLKKVDLYYTKFVIPKLLKRQTDL